MPDIVTRERDSAAFDALIAANIDPRMARLYAARGVANALDLNHELKTLLAPNELAHIQDAAILLADAIKANKRLLIVADYDEIGRAHV